MVVFLLRRLANYVVLALTATFLAFTLASVAGLGGQRDRDADRACVASPDPVEEHGDPADDAVFARD